MLPNFHVPFTILFFFLFLSITSCLNIVFSEPLDDTNFNTWISWHVQRYKEKSAVVTQKTSVASNWKQRLAEVDRTELTVSQDGSGDFITITEAVNRIPLRNTRRVVIRLSSGIYREKVSIPRTMRFVTLVGNASDPPTITGNDTASTVGGRDGTQLRTFQSATVAVDADYFVAINVKFEPHHRASSASASPPAPPPPRLHRRLRLRLPGSTERCLGLPLSASSAAASSPLRVHRRLRLRLPGSTARCRCLRLPLRASSTASAADFPAPPRATTPLSYPHISATSAQPPSIGEGLCLRSKLQHPPRSTSSFYRDYSWIIAVPAANLD